MRIGEVLSRSVNDINSDKTKLHIHNTLTRAEKKIHLLWIKTILNEELSNNITNIYGLLFWDFEKNTFISDKEINAWLRRINKKYNISSYLQLFSTLITIDTNINQFIKVYHIFDRLQYK